MSDVLLIDGRQLLPIKDVVSRSRYTRDYIAKLAREGVIVGAQVGRQWYVDETSLVQFTEASELEAEVRRRHLSVERRRERDLRAEVERQWDVVPKQPRYGRARAVAASVAVVCVAVLSVFAAQQVPGAMLHIASLQKTQVVQVGVGAAPATATGVREDLVAFVAETDTVPEETVSLVFADIETSETLTSSSAVLFIPEAAATSAGAVAAMFSDPVTVTFTAPGEGVVTGSSSAGTSSVSFVAVPLSMTRDDTSGVIPTTP